jgi:hypothetical protein
VKAESAHPGSRGHCVAGVHDEVAVVGARADQQEALEGAAVCSQLLRGDVVVDVGLTPAGAFPSSIA